MWSGRSGEREMYSEELKRAPLERSTSYFRQRTIYIVDILRTHALVEAWYKVTSMA